MTNTTTHNQHNQHFRYPQRLVQTLARAYTEIVAQAEQASPWVALNEFFHEWWDYSRNDHAQLIAEEVLPGGSSALLDPPSDTPLGNLSLSERDRRWRWAVFCAAVADYLAACEGMVPPAWVTDPRYTLAEPWYVVGTVDTGGSGDSGIHGDRGDTTEATEARVPRESLLPGMLLHLERTTPRQMRRRNIFCSDSIFANKYEFAQQVKQVVAARAARVDQANHHASPAMQTPASTAPNSTTDRASQAKARPGARLGKQEVWCGR